MSDCQCHMGTCRLMFLELLNFHMEMQSHLNSCFYSNYGIVNHISWIYRIILLCIYPMFATSLLLYWHVETHVYTCCVEMCVKYPIPQPSSLQIVTKAVQFLMLTGYADLDPHRVAWFLRWLSEAFTLVVEWLTTVSFLFTSNLFFHFWAIFGRKWLSIGSSVCWCQSMLSEFVCFIQALDCLKCECISQLWQGWDRNYFEGWS